MAAAMKIVAMPRSRSYVRRVFKVTLSGTYVTGGIVLDLTGMTNPNGIDGAKQVAQLPVFWELLNHPIGSNVDFQIVDGTTLANAKLKLTVVSTGAELANAAALTNLTGADAFTIAADTLVGK